MDIPQLVLHRGLRFLFSLLDVVFQESQFLPRSGYE